MRQLSCTIIAASYQNNLWGNITDITQAQDRVERASDVMLIKDM